MPYREPLTEDEKGQEIHGFNMRDDKDPLDDPVKCVCGWEGTKRWLMSASGMKYDVEFIYCPECGSDDVGEV